MTSWPSSPSARLLSGSRDSLPNVDQAMQLLRAANPNGLREVSR